MTLKISTTEPLGRVQEREMVVDVVELTSIFGRPETVVKEQVKCICHCVVGQGKDLHIKMLFLKSTRALDRLFDMAVIDML